ncbi:hypothetical protein Gasu2_43070 [Galdieria sulphuraria]|nr:hypothetical protein Gasu2_43070 [Galdieria sulphuraria]
MKKNGLTSKKLRNILILWKIEYIRAIFTSLTNRVSSDLIYLMHPHLVNRSISVWNSTAQSPLEFRSP